MAPLHLEARLALSTLQQQLGRPESALEALEPMYDPDTLVQDSSAAQQVRVQAHAHVGFSSAVPFVNVQRLQPQTQCVLFAFRS